MSHNSRKVPLRDARAYGLAIVALVLLPMAKVQRAHTQANTADLVGTVTDAGGAIVAGAEISLTDTDTGARRTAASATSGDFTFTLLQPGPYALKVRSPSFKQYEASSILLTAGDRLRVDAVLTVGNVSESVRVDASTTPALQTDSSTVESSVSEEQVQDIPLNGRNFASLVVTAPGVNAGLPSGIPSGGAPDDRRQSSSVVANGQSFLSNNQLIDGLDNNEREQGVIGVRPSIDAISEIRVITTNYPAEVGRAAGAVVNIITKAGTNAFHGSAYEFFRNDIFDARDAKSVVGPKSEFRQNQFGGSAEGPSIRNKTFFFFAYEALRHVQGKTDTSTVPTLFEEQNPGNFSDIISPKTGPGPVIPAAKLNQVALNYFSLYPAPNTPAQIAADGTPLDCYTCLPKQTLFTKTIDGRVDHHLNDDNTLFAHYSYNPVSVLTPGKLAPASAFGTTGASGGVNNFGDVFANIGGPSDITAQGISIGYLHIFSPSLVMELKTGFTRVNIQALPLDYGSKLSSKLGVVNSYLGTADTSGLSPVLFFGGPYASLGDGFFVPILNRNNNFQYNGTATWTHSAHTIKFGASVVRRQLNYFQDQFSPQGGFSEFGFGDYANAMVNFLVGQGMGSQRGNLLIHPGYRMWEPSGFAQDDWHATKSLTLNLGVRYDILTPFTEVKNQYSNFNPSTLSIQIAGKTTSSTLGIRTKYTNFSPRLGFAYSMPHDTVIRAGFGIGFFPVDFQNTIQNANPPYSFLCFPFCGTSFPELPLPASGSIANPSGTLTYKPSNFQPGYNEQFNLTVQKDIKGNVVTASYVGVLGRKQLAKHDLDRPLPPGPGNPKPDFVYAKQLRNVSSTAWNFNGAITNYNALQLVYERRAQKGLTISANFTFAHGLINGSPVGTSGDANGLITGDVNQDYGNSSLDIRHRVSVTGNYKIPLGNTSRGVAALLLKSWQFTVLGYWQTGLPFTVLNGNPQINLPNVGQDRPNGVGKVSLSNPSPGRWFDPAGSAPQTPGTVGNERRNQYYGPHDRRVDLSLFKDFPLYDEVKLQFRAESFNISNTPNWGAPANDISGSGVGTIGNTSPSEIPRQYQFALKLQS